MKKIKSTYMLLALMAATCFGGMFSSCTEELNLLELPYLFRPINVDATLKLARELRIPVIASGGLTHLKDVEELCKLEFEGISGVITGRAIYEGTLDFKQAVALSIKLAEKLSEK